MTAAEPTAPLLEVRDLSVEFRSGDRTAQVVDSVSLSVRPGETLGIVGESGSGKSLTALSILGLVPKPGRITGGRVLFEGNDLLTARRSDLERIRGREIAMIFQDPMTSLNPVLTIGRQLQEVLVKHLGMSAAEARARSIELLDIVGIPSPDRRIDDYPFRLSGGMRQRVMIAMAIACRPKLLIADEPTTALDVTIQAQILGIVRNLQTELKMAMLLITHDLGVVAGMSDRVCVMYGGRVVEEGTTDDVFERPGMPYTVGLLRSLPRLDANTAEWLRPIRGTPPDGFGSPERCKFAPRCDFAADICRQARPARRDVGADHTTLCHFAPFSEART